MADWQSLAYMYQVMYSDACFTGQEGLGCHKRDCTTQITVPLLLTVRIVAAELMASPSADQRQQRGCGIKSLAKAARQNPARVFAILAGIAFVCLLGTFVAQVVLAIVHGVSATSFAPSGSMGCANGSSRCACNHPARGRSFCHWSPTILRLYRLCNATCSAPCRRGMAVL